jgi:hypothetical protein
LIQSGGEGEIFSKGLPDSPKISSSPSSNHIGWNESGGKALVPANGAVCVVKLQASLGGGETDESVLKTEIRGLLK